MILKHIRIHKALKNKIKRIKNITENKLLNNNKLV